MKTNQKMMKILNGALGTIPIDLNRLSFRWTRLASLKLGIIDIFKNVTFFRL